MVENRPAFDLIDEHAGIKDLVMYIDPPYPGATRSQNRRRYAVDEPSTRFHEELAEHLQAVRGQVLVSGRCCLTYDRLFKGWDSLYIPVRGNGTADQVEIVWSNMALPVPDIVTNTGVDDGGCDENRCLVCGRVITRAGRGRTPRYCCGACRTAAYRTRSFRVAT